MRGRGTDLERAGGTMEERESAAIEMGGFCRLIGLSKTASATCKKKKKKVGGV